MKTKQKNKNYTLAVNPNHKNYDKLHTNHNTSIENQINGLKVMNRRARRTIDAALRSSELKKRLKK